MNRLIVIILSFVFVLPASAQEKKYDSFWDHKFGKFLKRVDGMIDHWQEEGVDTNYIRKQKLDRMVYLGYYGYFQQHDMTFPIMVHDEDVPYGSQYKPSNMDQLKYVWANMHTYQSEVELGIDWRGIAIEIPIPVRNRYSLSLGLAKNGSVWGARIRYKSLKRMTGVFEDAYDQGLDQWRSNSENNVESPASFEPVEKKIESGQMNLSIFYVEGYYVFNNKKFSLAAAAYGDMVQKRNAGSFFVMANYYQSKFSANNLFDYASDSFRNWKISIGPGYGYNWSLLNGRMCLHASYIPMISLVNHLTHTGYLEDGTAVPDAERVKSNTYHDNYYDAVDNGRSNLVFNFFGRVALSYSWNRYLFNFLINYRQYMYRNNADTKINNREADAQFNIGFRF